MNEHSRILKNCMSASESKENMRENCIALTFTHTHTYTIKDWNNTAQQERIKNSTKGD